MKFSLFFSCLLLLLTPLRAGNAARAVAPAFPRFPESSRIDFSKTLEAPAGRRGFVTAAKDGKFRFADGARARFWGINVSSTRLNIPKAQIEKVVRLFARAGLNMLRLEAIDNRNCLLGSGDAPTSRAFDPQYLDRIHYWMDAARRHGLYYYLDLLDFRTFKAGDGALNAEKLDRGARPYAVFDRHLIALQKEFATDLLTRRNPYSGLRPVDDPALALVEICNEHGFFLYPEKLETLVEPYRTDLRNRWNDWLKARYATREKLRAAWGMLGTFSVLRDDEDPYRRAVDLPSLVGELIASDTGIGDVRRAPRRRSDGVRFLAEVQRAYFREMRAHLRSIGLRVPVTAVVSNDVIPDVASAAAECDFTSENWYGEGISGDARFPGYRYYSNRNTLRDDSRGGYAPFLAALRWRGKPVVVREWGTHWPNTRRANSVPEALAYAALQDFDAVLLFGYQTNTALNGAEADALNDYAFQADPTVWGLMALAGQAFLRGDIAAARKTVTLAYADARLHAWPNRIGDLSRAAWSHRVNSVEGSAAQAGGNIAVAPTGAKRDKTLLARLLKQAGGGTPLQTGVWRSDTGQITRRTRAGQLEIRAPRLRVHSGEWKPGKAYNLGGGLRFSTPNAYGTLLALALDGRPLERSRHLVVKMVTRAENAGQVFEKAPPGSVNAWVLKARGQAPVVTLGRPSPQPTRLWLPGSAGKPGSPPALALWLQNGTWELEVKDGRARLACDTPGARQVVRLPRFD